MKSTKKSLFLILLFIGIALVIVGIIFTPPFGAKYVKKVDTLSPSQISKIISFQLFSIIAGFLMVLVSILFLNRKYVKYTIIPFIIIVFLFTYNVYENYINKVYPENIIFKSSGVEKSLNVLLGKYIVLGDYQPKSVLVVENKKILKARYPAIDVHFHLGSMEKMNAEELVKAMDACGIDKIVNLDGEKGSYEKYTRDFKDKYPDRFIMFIVLPLHEIVQDQPGSPNKQLATLDNAVKSGVRGLKVHKGLGLRIKDKSGRLVHIDDPRLEPIWEKAGELGIPVLMHVGDPAPFFSPVNRFNERYEELKDFPDWSYYGTEFPVRETLLSQRENLVKKHPHTIFIMAHMGDNSENLAYIAHLMDKYPNYYVDISSRLPELGRQPYTARKFLIKYQDRILFGTDGGYGLDPKGPWSAERWYRTYFEFLETTNEYFEYPLSGIQKQGRWNIYGVDLPEEVLRKLYYKNAQKLLFKK